MVKTSVKKNLYWEVKDKVIEEAFNGVRSVKRSQKVKVYGTDSTRDVRARLIEILRERVQLHKDKFVSPLLHQEMSSMTVKKNGKVEHMDNAHDDQIFSYLMALYVWYDGKDLAERFHILKNTIKTDQDVDIEELDIEDTVEAIAPVDFETASYDPDSDIARDIEIIQRDSKMITTRDIKNEYFIKTSQQRDLILATNKEARETYARETGVNPDMYTNAQAATYVELPDILFTNMDDIYAEENERVNSVLAGNMAQWWDKV